MEQATATDRRIVRPDWIWGDLNGLLVARESNELALRTLPEPDGVQVFEGWVLVASVLDCRLQFDALPARRRLNGALRESEQFHLFGNSRKPLFADTDPVFRV